MRCWSRCREVEAAEHVNPILHRRLGEFSSSVPGVVKISICLIWPYVAESAFTTDQMTCRKRDQGPEKWTPLVSTTRS